MTFQEVSSPLLVILPQYNINIVIPEKPYLIENLHYGKIVLILEILPKALETIRCILWDDVGRWPARFVLDETPEVRQTFEALEAYEEHLRVD